MIQKAAGYRLALFFTVGTIAGILVAPALSDRAQKSVLAGIIAVAVLFLVLIVIGEKIQWMRPGKSQRGTPDGESLEIREFISEATHDEVLSPEEAREWLDEFLVRQQKDT